MQGAGFSLYNRRMKFKPTNEMEKLLASGTKVLTAEFITAMMPSSLDIWTAPPEPGDDPRNMSLRVAKADNGDLICFAFTSEKAFEFYIESEKIEAQSFTEILGDDFFTLVAESHDVLINWGHEFFGHIPKGTLVKAE